MPKLTYTSEIELVLLSEHFNLPSEKIAEIAISYLRLLTMQDGTNLTEKEIINLAKAGSEKYQQKLKEVKK